MLVWSLLMDIGLFGEALSHYVGRIYVTRLPRVKSFGYLFRHNPVTALTAGVSDDVVWLAGRVPFVLTL